MPPENRVPTWFSDLGWVGDVEVYLVFRWDNFTASSVPKTKDPVLRGGVFSVVCPWHMEKGVCAPLGGARVRTTWKAVLQGGEFDFSKTEQDHLHLERDVRSQLLAG